MTETAFGFPSLNNPNEFLSDGKYIVLEPIVSVKNEEELSQLNLKFPERLREIRRTQRRTVLPQAQNGLKRHEKPKYTVYL